jgi:hypothetical protein
VTLRSNYNSWESSGSHTCIKFICRLRLLVVTVWLGFYARGIPITVGSYIRITKVSNLVTVSVIALGRHFLNCQFIYQNWFLILTSHLSPSRSLTRNQFSDNSLPDIRILNIFHHLKIRNFLSTGEFTTRARNPPVLSRVATNNFLTKANRDPRRSCACCVACC